jgi:zinc protease
MKIFLTTLIVLGILMPLTIAGQNKTTTSQNKIFPYNYSSDDLPNGLRVITIPTDYPNIVALYIVVGTGSRNEVEPGKSGFAHLFEHLMFRGTEKVSAEKYNELLQRAGADTNAYTSDDRTVYHTVFSKEDLDQIMMLEADRFQNLKVPEELFKTETRAVLGEYNKNSSNPISKLFETVRDTAFKKHTYQHTTMGFLRDVENMPNLYDYSLEFFKRYYRPEYTTIIVSGDVKPANVLAIVKKYWGDWKRGDYVPQIPTEPEQAEERTANVEWPQPTLPWIAVAYKGPAYSDEQKDKPALDLAASLGFSQTSDLYQRLVIKEQKVDTLFADFGDHPDPYLFTVGARVKDVKDVDYVRGEIIKTFD